MSWDEILKFAGASIFSVVSAGTAIAALASWFGKIWAEKIIAREANELKQQLGESQHKLDVSLKRAERELDVLKEAQARVHNEKISSYREIVDLVAKILANFDAKQMPDASDEAVTLLLQNFNEQRIRLYGYTAMFAPQAVMDAQDELIDHLLLVTYGQATYVWPEIRELALNLINEVRRDIGIDKSGICYNGKL